MVLAADFGKVAVLMGGNSAEREISLKSGEAVLAALLRQNINAYKVDVGVNINADLVTGKFDRAFVILHGRGGEDGQIQGVLDSLAIPYSGSSMEGSVLSMNKALSKVLWQQQNLPTAEFELVTRETNLDGLVAKLGLPLFIKPVNEGSSIGMTKVNATSELAEAINLALDYDSEVIAESWIDGDEYTVGIVAGETLPVIQLVTPNEFYDFDAKYQADTTQYLCPTNLTASEEAQCQSIAKKAFDGVRMSGWGRIDFMRNKSGQFYLLEANSVPGMTDHSLVPMAAKESDMSFDQLVWKILETSMGNNNG